jgi:hypothetical protein
MSQRGDRHSARLWGEIVVAGASAVWMVITLPFRLVFRAIAWLGRLTALALGFTVMVLGIALWAGGFFYAGIPVFLIGLVFLLRSRE